MIDFIRVHYNDKSRLEPFVMKQENFDKMYSSLEYHSGEVLYPYKVNIENIEIVLNERGGYVKNSLHKLNNLLIDGKEHNYNDFTYSQLCYTIDFLTDRIIDISEEKLTQFEFGFNLNITKSAESIIAENILMQNSTRHTAVKRFKGKGYLLEFEHYNYLIKIYDKAKQYKRNENILRFEIKFLSRKEFNPLGIYSIEDFKNKENLINLFKYLMKRYDELVIVDNISDNLKIPLNDIDKLNAFSSFIYWENLSKNNKRQTKMRHKKQYYKLLENYDLQTTKNMLRNQLIEKFKNLINE